MKPNRSRSERTKPDGTSAPAPVRNTDAKCPASSHPLEIPVAAAELGEFTNGSKEGLRTCVRAPVAENVEHLSQSDSYFGAPLQLPDDVQELRVADEDESCGEASEEVTQWALSTLVFGALSITGLVAIIGVYVGYRVYAYYVQLGLAGAVYQWTFVTAAVMLAIGLIVLLYRQGRSYWKLRELGTLQRELAAVRDEQGTRPISEERRLCGAINDWLNALLRNRSLCPGELSSIRSECDHSKYADDWVKAVEESLLRNMDRRAKEIIEEEARAVGMLTALSPYGFIDAAIVLWRNSRMVLRIAEAYGARPSSFGSLYLLRCVMVNVALGALSQEVMDRYYQTFGIKVAGVAAKGVGAGGALLARGGVTVAASQPLIGGAMAAVGSVISMISGSVGEAAHEFAGPVLQGFLTGILTIRIGLAAQQQCRLVPMSEEERRKSVASLLSTLLGIVRGKAVRAKDKDMTDAGPAMSP